MREGRQDRELRQVQLDLEQEIHEPLDVVLILFVDAEDDRAFDADAALLQTLDAVPDVVRRIEDGLVHVPAAGLGGQVQDLVVVLDRDGRPTSS